MLSYKKGDSVTLSEESRSPRQLWNALLQGVLSVKDEKERVAVPVNYGMLSYIL